MALTKEINLDNGVTMPNAYIKIASLNNMIGVKMEIKVNLYMTQSHRNDGKPPVVQYTHTCTDEYFTYFGYDVANADGINGVMLGYLWLKTLPFYVDATDVSDAKE